MEPCLRRLMRPSRHALPGHCAPVRFAADGCSRMDECIHSSMDESRTASRVVHALLWVNIGLQVCDGVATYHGLQHGLQEGNPLLRELMARWGVGWALLGTKSGACALLVSLRALDMPRLRARALLVT